MRERVYLTVAVVSGALAVSGCTTNLYTGERGAGKSAISAGLSSLVGASIGALPSSRKDRGKGVLIGAVVGTALSGSVGCYMDVQEARLCDKVRGTGVSVARSGDSVILNMPNNVTLDSSGATLKPAGANTLIGMAMVLKEYPKTAVSAIDYTDNTRSRDPNIHLSQQHADSVANTLITQSVGASRIRTQDSGPVNSVTSNNTAEGKT